MCVCVCSLVIAVVGINNVEKPASSAREKIDLELLNVHFGPLVDGVERMVRATICVCARALFGARNIAHDITEYARNNNNHIFLEWESIVSVFELAEEMLNSWKTEENIEQRNICARLLCAF